MANKIDEPKIKFDYTLQKNICMYLKRIGGYATMIGIIDEFKTDSPFVIEAMIKSLKGKKYIIVDNQDIRLSDNLYCLLQA